MPVTVLYAHKNTEIVSTDLREIKKKYKRYNNHSKVRLIVLFISRKCNFKFLSVYSRTKSLGTS